MTDQPQQPTDRVTCKQCKFWHAHKSELNPHLQIRTGECRYQPPVLYRAPVPQNAEDIDTYSGTRWPVTKPADWCGRAEAMPAKRAA